MPRAILGQLAISTLLALALAGCGGADRKTAAADADAFAVPERAEASSTELIDAAQARGEIDADTALAYRAYALFGDRRLPASLGGGQSEEFDAAAAEQLREALPAASPATRQLVAAFLRRPNEAGSWAAPPADAEPFAARSRHTVRASGATPIGRACAAETAGWSTIAPAGGHFKVWFADAHPSDRSVAEGLSDTLEHDTWPNLIAARKLQARLEEGAAPPSADCAVQDARIDVYLVHGIRASAMTIRPEPGSGTAGNAFVLVNAESGAAGALAAPREVVQAVRGQTQARAPAGSAPRSRTLAVTSTLDAVPPPSIVQSKSASLPAGVSTLTLDQPVAAGQWIVVAVSSIDSSPVNLLLSDNQGHANAAFASTGLRYSNKFGTVWRSVKTAQAGAYSLSVNRGAASSANVQVFELADVDATTLLDIAAASGSGTGRTASTTFATPTATPNDLLLSALSVRSTTASVAPSAPIGLQRADLVSGSAISSGVYALGVVATATYRMAASISTRNQWRMSSLAIRGRPALPPVVIAPVNTALPVVTATGTAPTLSLSVTPGSWANDPTSYAYSWTKDGVTIPDAVLPSYTTSIIDAGSAIAAVVTASNSAGSASANSAAVQIPVPPPLGAPTLTFDATPSTIFEGQSTSLVWSSANTIACTASGTWSGGQPTSGSMVVTPAATSTYGLECAGDAGSVSAQATVTVAPNPPLANPSTGAHGSAFHISQGSVGDWLPTPPMTTQASGSTMLVFVGKGSIWNLAPPIDNKGNSPYVQVGAINQYKKWPGEGTTTYAFNSMAGGANHIVSVNDSNVWDEVSFAAVEIRNGGLIQDHKWNEVLNSPTQTSLSVTTTGPATLVAAWFGDDSSSTPSKPVPNNGFTIVEAVTGAVETVQMVVATRDVPAAGTYNVTWTTTPVQGAQLYLVAVQKKP
jgi:hypothetical protein